MSYHKEHIHACTASSRLRSRGLSWVILGVECGSTAVLTGMNAVDESQKAEEEVEELFVACRFEEASQRAAELLLEEERNESKVL